MIILNLSCADLSKEEEEDVQFKQVPSPFLFFYSETLT
jgi:hypothetical protein